MENKKKEAGQAGRKFNMNYYKTKNDLLLHRHDLFRAVSETREVSLIPGICFNVLLRASYDLQNLLPLDAFIIFSMKEIAEELEDNKRMIMKTYDDSKAVSDEGCHGNK